MNEWISIEDKLPNNDSMVLVVSLGCDSNDSMVLAVSLVCDSKEGYLCQKLRPWIYQGRFNPHSGWKVYYGGYGDYVTHWMPMPELPEIPKDVS